MSAANAARAADREPENPENVGYLWVDPRSPTRKHAAARDNDLRAHEMLVPDVDGHKYRVQGGDGLPSTLLSLQHAVRLFLDRDDARDVVSVEGSGRPVVIWHKTKHTRRPKIHYSGASAVEARAIHEREMFQEPGTAPVILRVRMRRSTIRRIQDQAERERKTFGEPGIPAGRNMSAYVLDAILKKLEADEAVAAALQAAYPQK